MSFGDGMQPDKAAVETNKHPAKLTRPGGVARSIVGSHSAQRERTRVHLRVCAATDEAVAAHVREVVVEVSIVEQQAPDSLTGEGEA